MYEKIRLYEGDCIEVMKMFKDSSVDMVMVDPPYGTTRNKWDDIIPLEPMWKQLNRICKTNAAMVFTTAEPFTSKLIMSNTKYFKYDIIWEKTVASGQLNVKYMPLRVHENVLVFYRKKPTYNEQKTKGSPYSIKRSIKTEQCYGTQKDNSKINEGYRHAKSVIKISNPRVKGGHPTQKPVELLEYFIQTYTNEEDVVLDFSMGSGSTGVACKNLNREFIGIEKDKSWFGIAKERFLDD